MRRSSARREHRRRTKAAVVSIVCGAPGLQVCGMLGDAKVRRLQTMCRVVIDDYESPDWREQLDAATPAGVDVVYENVGGPIMDHLLGRLNLGARIALCGMISEYNTYGSPADRPGQRDIMQLVMSRASIAGFLVFDHVERFPEAIEHLVGLMAEGKLKYEETVVDGLERAGGAVNGLFEGTNTGKLLVKVAEPVIDAPTQQRAVGTVSSG